VAVSMVGGQAPPQPCCTMERVRVLKPSPTVTLQELQAHHSETMQAEPQGRVSTVAGQGNPPPDGHWMMERVRVWTQDWGLQPLQADHSDTTQFTEQLGKLHRWVATSCWQFWSNRLRICTPSPHVTLHEDQLDQSVGHGVGLQQAWVWVVTGQAEPQPG